MGKTELSKVLRPTRNKIGHFADVLPSQSLGSVLKKLTYGFNRLIHWPWIRMGEVLA